MIIVAMVKTGAKDDSVVYDETASLYLVSVKARPIEGEANAAVVKLLAKELGVPKTSIAFVSGARSRVKRFEVES